MGDEYRIKHFFDNWLGEGGGGYTVVTNLTRKVMGIAICSPQDQYGRKKGVRIAKERIDNLIVELHGSPLDPDSGNDMVIISAPQIRSMRSGAFDLLRAAVSNSVRRAMEFCPVGGGVLVMFEEKVPKKTIVSKGVLDA